VQQWVIAAALGLATAIGPGRALCQTPPVMGEVLDASTGLPVPGVLVEFVDLQLSTTTDSLGYFAFSAAALGEHVLSVGRLGYEGIEQRVLVQSGARFDIRIYPRPLQLQEVVAVGEARDPGSATDPGRPDDRVTSNEMRDLEGRVSKLVGVLRLKIGPRLQIREGRGGGGLIDYCIESTRRTPSVAETTAQAAMGGCRPALISVDGVVTFWPPLAGMTSPRSGPAFATIAAAEVLRFRPDEIEDVRFLSPVAAFQRFGEEGRFGALIIRTRRGG